MSKSISSDNRRDVGSTKSTFEITVKFMQNSTWQGEVLWVEKNRKQNFRSALEMLKLMDEAITDGVEETKVINW